MRMVRSALTMLKATAASNRQSAVFSLLQRHSMRLISGSACSVSPRTQNAADELKASIDEYNQGQLELLRVVHKVVESNKLMDDGHSFRDTLESMGYGRQTPAVHRELFDSNPNTPALAALAAVADYKELATSVLYKAYLNARCHPWLIGLAMTTDGEYAMEEAQQVQRWQGQWRRQVVQRHKHIMKPGMVIDTDLDTGQPLTVQYHRDLRTHFSNAPAHNKKNMRLGATHVALGFNDLQTLLQASISKNNNSTSRFIGYDRSTYSVAKSLVLVDMLMKSAPPEQVVQAWYSSTWSRETTETFLGSCAAVLKKRSAPLSVASSSSLESSSVSSATGNANDKIDGYLRHWATTRIPIAACDAIQQWFLESCTEKCSHVYTQTCSFHRKQDRISLLHYFMTGEFGFSAKDPHTDTRVGSLTMWSVPDFAPPANKSDQDRVTNTVLFQTILDTMENGDGTTSTDSVMDIIYNIKVKQVRRLQQLVQSGRLEIDLRYGDIQPLNGSKDELAEEISDLSPTTISWSNLLDYMPLTELHTLAKFWSTSGTTHYGYTMNWPMTCYGTFMSDYLSVEERKQILEDTIGKQVFAEARESGVVKMLTVPTLEHTEDQASERLAQRMRPAWVSYFRHAASGGVGDNSGISLKDDIPIGWPVSRSNRSIYLAWKYDGLHEI